MHLFCVQRSCWAFRRGEVEFGQLAEFLKSHPFDRVGAFAFSPEDGTSAALMDGQVEEHVKQERLDAIMRAQRHISLELNRKRVGKTENVLVERVSGDMAMAEAMRKRLTWMA